MQTESPLPPIEERSSTIEMDKSLSSSKLIPDDKKKKQPINPLALQSISKKTPSSFDIEEGKRTMDYDDNVEESGPKLNNEDDVWAYLFLADGKEPDDFENTRTLNDREIEPDTGADPNEPELVKD